MQEVEKGVIGICDDQEVVLHQLQQIIEEICTEKKLDWEVRTYLFSREMLEHLAELAIVFLDIDMPEMDGIEIGKIIKQKNPECRIIMATGTVERYKEAFQIQAMRFVTKPFDKAEVEEALLAAIGKSLGRQLVEVYQQRNKYRIRQADIQFAEAFNGCAEVTAGGQVFRKDISLDELEKQLDERIFVRINRKFIVNLRYVQFHKPAHIRVGNIEMPISRRKKKEFECKYIEFDLKYRGEML